jgi:hypothetical protein
MICQKKSQLSISLSQTGLIRLFLPFHFALRKLIALSLFIYISRKPFIFDLMAKTSKDAAFHLSQMFVRACSDSQELHQFKPRYIMENWLFVSNGLLWWKRNAAMNLIGLSWQCHFGTFHHTTISERKSNVTV